MMSCDEKMGRKQKKAELTGLFSRKCSWSYSHSVEEPSPYIESFHNRPLSWTLPLLILLLALQRQSIHWSPRKLSQEIKSQLRVPFNGPKGGESQFALLWAHFWKRRHLHIFLLLARVMFFFGRVSCEFAGNTCCNLHAEYAGGCSLQASMMKEPEKVGLIIGWTCRKWRPPPLTRWVIFFDGYDEFWNVLEAWSLIISSEIFASSLSFPKLHPQKVSVNFTSMRYYTFASSIPTFPRIGRSTIMPTYLSIPFQISCLSREIEDGTPIDFNLLYILTFCLASSILPRELLPMKNSIFSEI